MSLFVVLPTWYWAVLGTACAVCAGIALIWAVAYHEPTQEYLTRDRSFVSWVKSFGRHK